MSQNRCHTQKILCERCQIQSKDRELSKSSLDIPFSHLSSATQFQTGKMMNEFNYDHIRFFFFFNKWKWLNTRKKNITYLGHVRVGIFIMKSYIFTLEKKSHPKKRTAWPFQCVVLSSAVLFFLQRFITFFGSIVFVLVPFGLGSSRVFLDFFMLMFTLVWLTTLEWSSVTHFQHFNNVFRHQLFERFIWRSNGWWNDTLQTSL